MHRVSCLSLLLLVFVATGFSQSSSDLASITGIVQDQTGAVIAGASVLLSLDNIPQQSTTTDQSGHFRFSRISSNTYQIQVTSEGFEPTTIDEIVGSQPPAPFRITMAVAAQPARRLQLSFRMKF